MQAVNADDAADYYKTVGNLRTGHQLLRIMLTGKEIEDFVVMFTGGFLKLKQNLEEQARENLRRELIRGYGRAPAGPGQPAPGGGEGEGRRHDRTQDSRRTLAAPPEPSNQSRLQRLGIEVSG